MKSKYWPCFLGAIFLALWGIEFASRKVKFPGKLIFKNTLVGVIDKISGITEVELPPPARHVAKLIRDVVDNSSKTTGVEFTIPSRDIAEFDGDIEDRVSGITAIEPTTRARHVSRLFRDIADNTSRVTEVEFATPGQDVVESNREIVDTLRRVTLVEFATPNRDFTELERDRCDQLQNLNDEQIFQPADANNNSYVISALWDNVDRTRQKLRIVGMIHASKLDVVTWYCYIRDRESKKCTRVKATVKKHPFDIRNRICGRLFLCPLLRDIVPDGVSLMTPGSGPILYNRLSVIRDDGKEHTRYNFTVCVSRFHSNYNNSLQLITMIELDMILGAEFFVFYNYSMSESIGVIVLKLVKEGSAMLVQWQLPNGPVAKYGHLPMINDCMNRMMYRTRFISETDYDEFIIPIKHTKWQELVDEKQKEFPESGVFIAQTKFYLTESANHSFKFPGRDIAEKYHVLPLLNLERRTDIPSRLRLSKYIYDPRKVENLWVHVPSELRDPWTAVIFRDYEAVHHHYRNVFKLERLLKGPKTFKTDTTMFRYKDELLNRVKIRVEELKQYYGMTLL